MQVKASGQWEKDCHNTVMWVMGTPLCNEGNSEEHRSNLHPRWLAIGRLSVYLIVQPIEASLISSEQVSDLLRRYPSQGRSYLKAAFAQLLVGVGTAEVD